MQYIIVAGNVVDGFAFYGPFENANDAGDYAKEFFNDGWVVATVLKPFGKGSI